jgi:hypothetical protein
MGCKFFIAQALEGILHFSERLAGGWPRRLERPGAFGATAALKARLFNPYQLAKHGGCGTPGKVGCCLGPSLSLQTGSPYAGAEWTSGKNDSRILRIDTVGSAAWPGGSQHFLWFLICGLGHSDNRGTKSSRQRFLRKALISTQLIALIVGSIPSLTLLVVAYSL